MKIEDLKIAVVAPLHKMPKEEWLSALSQATKDKAQVMFVDDSPDQNLKVLMGAAYSKFIVFNREDQKNELVDKYEYFHLFQKSSACRNFGNYMAWKREYDIITGLDSDCIVPMNFIDEHFKALQMEGHGWTNPIKVEGWFPRGYPYAERSRKVVANLGLWGHVLDINAKDRGEHEPIEPTLGREYMENNLQAETFIPFSGMNWAMWREAMPGFLFLPNFNFTSKEKEHQFRRHDDIWGGYIFQRLMEKRNERIVYGKPIVYHDTIIDKDADITEEEGMIAFENTFYNAVDTIADKIEPSTYEDMIWQFAKLAETEWSSNEWQPLVKALMFWAELFTV